MIPLTVAKLAEIVGGEIAGIDPTTIVNGDFFFDSRAPIKGGVFVALIGNSNDGHDYIAKAISSGAVLALVSLEVKAPSIKVVNVLDALGKLANYVRMQIKDLKVIAITGSQGKTTTKDLLAHIFSAVGATTSPIGSYNNDLGVPLTLLKCNLDTKFCLVEMGARNIGDIAKLTNIAKPNVAVVLKVGSAHLGEFGSRENIAIAKGEIVIGLTPKDFAVLGSYDEFTPKMAMTTSAKVLSFGESSKFDIRAADVEYREGYAHFDLVTPQGREAVGLRILGMHQVANALAAAAAATALNVPIEVIASALSTAEVTSKWRMELKDINGLLIINDAYNANPESMMAALRTLALLSQERGGRSWAFLGTMHELGSLSESAHTEIATAAAALNIDHLVAIGNRHYQSAEPIEMVSHYYAQQSDAHELFSHFEVGDVILVKASRAEHLEIIAAEIAKFWSAKIIESEEMQ